MGESCCRHAAINRKCDRIWKFFGAPTQPPSHVSGTFGVWQWTDDVLSVKNFTRIGESGCCYTGLETANRTNVGIFGPPRNQSPSPLDEKFRVREWTLGVLIETKFHLDRCIVSPLNLNWQILADQKYRKLNPEMQRQSQSYNHAVRRNIMAYAYTLPVKKLRDL